MQEVKTFVYGKDNVTGKINTESLDDQINAYLSENPDRKVTSLSTIVGNGYREAFVVFDIREQRDDRKQNNTKKSAAQN